MWIIVDIYSRYIDTDYENNHVLPNATNLLLNSKF